ncbi:uncharacterized protein L969DRAFT_91271 [Mixia osmundae IAM 14324]|uniref:uncharacterized protein n=1 Tax=Mixia osmundae (strain CBS 9802 / IAM 14324 / JCM 22182 / KY 12970) TaxID=764103 RepID=UPI0004A5565C|nr:uncharacterized protein L969DRAFT_91271 [Mixia osmundae IAM 14324]KEI36108.1 hypothetical protein L969DRAFT_91271 [Mixia osmundae IAM 14324]
MLIHSIRKSEAVRLVRRHLANQLRGGFRVYLRQTSSLMQARGVSRTQTVCRLRHARLYQHVCAMTNR